MEPFHGVFTVDLEEPLPPVGPIDFLVVGAEVILGFAGGTLAAFPTVGLAELDPLVAGVKLCSNAL